MEHSISAISTTSVSAGWISARGVRQRWQAMVRRAIRVMEGRRRQLSSICLTRFSSIRQATSTLLSAIITLFARWKERPGSSPQSQVPALRATGDGGPASRAQLRQPHSVAVDRHGRSLLICDVGNHRIRRVDLATGVIETYAGTGETGDCRWRADCGSFAERTESHGFRFAGESVCRASRRKCDPSYRQPVANYSPPRRNR